MVAGKHGQLISFIIYLGYSVTKLLVLHYHVIILPQPVIKKAAEELFICHDYFVLYATNRLGSRYYRVHHSKMRRNVLKLVVHM